jgi:hypothetical protein
MSGLNRSFERHQRRRRLKEAIKAIQRVPKPPVVDGVCACGCCHVPDNGACPKYIAGLNDRCVVCDHSVVCHRRKGEAPPHNWNTPVKVQPNQRHLMPASSTGWEDRYIICPACKAPAMHCPACGTPIPIKKLIDVYHTGTCPKCGAVDVTCKTLKPDEKEPDAKPS